MSHTAQTARRAWAAASPRERAALVRLFPSATSLAFTTRRGGTVIPALIGIAGVVLRARRAGRTIGAQAAWEWFERTCAARAADADVRIAEHNPRFAATLRRLRRRDVVRDAAMSPEQSILGELGLAAPSPFWPGAHAAGRDYETVGEGAGLRRRAHVDRDGWSDDAAPDPRDRNDRPLGLDEVIR